VYLAADLRSVGKTRGLCDAADGTIEMLGPQPFDPGMTHDFTDNASLTIHP
jgi:hypothetical protein